MMCSSGIALVAAFLAATTAAAQGSYSRGTSQRPAEGMAVQRNDDLQPATLPPLPIGMTLEMITDGDRLFHGSAGCFACHGTEGQGLPAAGSAITVSLVYARTNWKSIDSLIIAGLPDVYTRSPIAMPARGARGDLTEEQASRVAAYVWAISQTRGEPWVGGHASHESMVPPGSTAGTAQAKPWTTRGRPQARPPRGSGR